MWEIFATGFAVLVAAVVGVISTIGAYQYAQNPNRSHYGWAIVAALIWSAALGMIIEGSEKQQDCVTQTEVQP